MPFWCDLQGKGTACPSWKVPQAPDQQMGATGPHDNPPEGIDSRLGEALPAEPTCFRWRGDEDDLPNLWPPRVAAATYLAVRRPCLLPNAVLHCPSMQHE